VPDQAKRRQGSRGGTSFIAKAVGEGLSVGMRGLAPSSGFSPIQVGATTRNQRGAHGGSANAKTKSHITHELKGHVAGIICTGKKEGCEGKKNCKCMDGTQFEMMEHSEVRMTVMTVLKVFGSCAGWFSHLVCYAVPPRGCNWEAAGGFDPRAKKWKDKLKEIGMVFPMPTVKPNGKPNPIWVSTCSTKQWRPVYKRIKYWQKSSELTARRRRRRGEKDLGEKVSWGKVGKFIKKKATSAVKYVKKKVAAGASYLAKKALTSAFKKMLNFLVKSAPRFHLQILKPLLEEMGIAMINKGFKAVKEVAKRIFNTYKLKSIQANKLIQWAQVIIPQEMLRMRCKSYAKDPLESIDRDPLVQKIRGINDVMKLCDRVEAMNPAHASNENHPQTTKVYVANNQRVFLLKTTEGGEIPSPVMDMYIIRGSFNYFDDLPRDTSFRKEKKTAKALQFVSCVDSKLKDHKDYTDAKRNKLIRSTCPHLPENLNKKIPHQTWQGCLMKVRLQMSRCSTCCCKAGYAKSTVTSSFTYGPKRHCAMWYNFADSIFRVTATVWRSCIINELMYSCFVLGYN